MDHKSRVALSATVHALGGYMFSPCYGAHDRTFHVVHKTDYSKAVLASAQWISAACTAKIPWGIKGGFACVKDFPQGAELCSGCSVALVGMPDDKEIPS